VSSMDDALAWTVLAVATSYQTGGSPANGAWAILLAIAWVLFLLLVARKVLERLRLKLSDSMFIVTVFIGLCSSAWVTQVLGLHAFFGGFIFGVCVPKSDKAWNEQLIHQLEVVVVNFFVPIFFCNTGLGTDLTQLQGVAGPIVLVIVLAASGKMLPPLLLGKVLCRYSWSFSFQLASLMNARGLVELIALTIAKESGAFNMKMYSVFVIMALTTTFMSGPMFYFSYDPKKDPPAALRASRLAGQVELLSEPQQPALELPVVACVEIPKDEQLDVEAAHQFSGYLYTGTVKGGQNVTRTTIAGKAWDEAEQVSRSSTTLTSSLVGESAQQHKMEEGGVLSDQQIAEGDERQGEEVVGKFDMSGEGAVVGSYIE